jgi:hypothetical protein
MDNFEKGSLVRQQSTQEVYNTTSFIRQVYAKNLNVENFSTSTPIPTSYVVDIMSMFDAITESPFSVASWTSSYIMEIPGSFVNNGESEIIGNFTDEPSSYNVIGISPNEDYGTKETALVNYSVRFTGGALLGSYEQSTSVRLGGFDNIEYTYKYEEDAAATGSNPKHIHDFRITVDSTQILGYVIINADDSEFHNFIIDSAA